MLWKRLGGGKNTKDKEGKEKKKRREKRGSEEDTTTHHGLLHCPGVKFRLAEKGTSNFLPPAAKFFKFLKRYKFKMV